MNTLNRKRTFGFTVIELMIVVIIISILVALAYPSYVQYARKAKRGEAQQLLLNWSINQEIWRSNNTGYNGVTCGAAGFMVPGYTPECELEAKNPYEFTPSEITATTYIVTAAAKGGSDQNNDTAKDGTDCSSIWLDQSGVKSPAACWE